MRYKEAHNISDVFWNEIVEYVTEGHFVVWKG